MTLILIFQYFEKFVNKYQEHYSLNMIITLNYTAITNSAMNQP
jgi:hypothetical protein